MSAGFAGHDEPQSGQRFLDSSVPRLIRHVVSCDGAGGDSISPSAGKDQKLSPEFEGGTLIGRAAPVPFAREARVSLLSLPYYRAIETNTRDGN